MSIAELPTVSQREATPGALASAILVIVAGLSAPDSGETRTGPQFEIWLALAVSFDARRVWRILVFASVATLKLATGYLPLVPRVLPDGRDSLASRRSVRGTKTSG